MRHFIRKLWLSAHVVTWVLVFLALLPRTVDAFHIGERLGSAVIAGVVLVLVYHGTVAWVHWLTKDFTWAK